MRRLTVSELLTATGGTLLAGGESAAVTSVSTDSRKAGEGALYPAHRRALRRTRLHRQGARARCGGLPVREDARGVPAR